MEKTLAIHLQELREKLAKEIETKLGCEEAASLVRESK